MHPFSTLSLEKRCTGKIGVECVFKRQSHKNGQTHSNNSSSVFDHFVGLARKRDNICTYDIEVDVLTLLNHL